MFACPVSSVFIPRQLNYLIVLKLSAFSLAISNMIFPSYFFLTICLHWSYFLPLLLYFSLAVLVLLCLLLLDQIICKYYSLIAYSNIVFFAYFVYSLLGFMFVVRNQVFFNANITSVLYLFFPKILS